MADSTNSISIQVLDVVAPEIAPKLIAIADASDKAANSMGSLARQMEGLKGSGIGSLATMLAKLESGTLKAATAQSTLATQIRETTSAAVGQATALNLDATALTSAAAAARTATTAGREKTLVDKEQTAGTQKMVSANISAAAGLGILEGRTLSMNRAAANFITRVLGLGPILQQAFAVIGAVALLAVLGQMAASLSKMLEAAINAPREIKKAFDEEINSASRANDELAVTNDKLEASIDKIQHKPTTNGMALAIHEAQLAADRLDESLESIGKRFEELQSKNQVGIVGGILTGQSPTSNIAKMMSTQYDSFTNGAETAIQNDMADTLSGQYKTPEAKQQAITEALQRGLRVRADAIQNFIGEMKSRRKDTEIFNANPLADEIVKSGSQGAYNDYTGAINLANTALNKLQLTASNMADNKTLDKLRDQVSGQSVATKQAVKDWKELEASFVSFQTASEKAGHKPTPQESLNWLQSAKNNPLNQDKLAAKELPFQTKITSDADWAKEQSERLQNQVSEIGLYNDALKEAGMLKTITQEADKRGIKLTDQQTDSFKQQIAAIVENRDYQKELESVYQSVNSAEDMYAAKTKALSTALKEGILTQAQFDQALTRTTRDYNEASNAVTAFQRKMADQQRDASNKLGSNRDIGANTELQTLAEQMRKGDATHPGGYAEAQIATQLAAMREQVKTQQDKNAVDQATNKLVFEQTNLYDELIVRQKALDAAVKAGTISQEAANIAKLQYWIKQNDMQLQKGTGGSVIEGAIADYAKQFAGVAAGIKESFSGVFKTLGDGFADTIGKALVGAKNLSAALKEVAKSAVSELISAFIKLGIQYVINLAMGTAAATAATAAGVAQATALGAAWAGPAIAASIATMGAADALGTAAYLTSLGVATAATAHADGGYITGPGTGRSDSIGAWLSNGEYVVNASATSQHRDMLDAINQGSSRETISTKFAPQVNASSNGAPRSNINVQVHNYNGSKVEIQHIDENTVRAIVRDEAPALVAKHAPGVIASQLDNPNSKVSKGISNNTFAARRR